MVQRFIEMRLIHNGVPEVVVVDQCGEFESTFAQEREEIWIDVRITGSHAGWQQSQVGRRGGVL